MDEAKLLLHGYRKYAGEEMDVYFNQEMCAHSGRCVSGAPEVFKVGRVPWIKLSPGCTNEVCHVIDICPSGALKYKMKGTEEILP